MKRKKEPGKIYNVMDVWQNEEHIRYLKKVTDI
jgi:hypothetical protein